MAERLVPVRLLTAQALGAAASVETPVIDYRKGSFDHGVLQLTSALSSVPAVRVQVAISIDGVTFNSYDAQDDIIANTATEWASYEEQAHSFLCTATAPFLKFKLTELGVTSDTIITLTGFLKEV